MTSRSWSSLGLALGMVGVLLLFKWGPPQPPHETGVTRGLEDATPIDDSGKTVADHNREVERRQRFYARMSRIGLALIFLGFLCQLVAVWWPSKD